MLCLIAPRTSTQHSRFIVRSETPWPCQELHNVVAEVVSTTVTTLLLAFLVFFAVILVGRYATPWGLEPRVASWKGALWFT